MSDMTPPSRFANGGRYRTKTIKVWRCDVCKATFDRQPLNTTTWSDDCPTCGASGSSIKERRVRE